MGHSFTNYLLNNDATCTTDGTKTAKCDRCNATDTVTDAGAIDHFTGAVCVEVPLTLNNALPEFRLVRVDVTEATEDTERTEVWTELEYTYEDGVLIFQTYTTVIFLLLPVQ